MIRVIQIAIGALAGATVGLVIHACCSNGNVHYGKGFGAGLGAVCGALLALVAGGWKIKGQPK